jgi:2-oxoglutarate ferredoxin oxidoreductase subunit gamma
MTQKEIVISGFGGQGAMFAGQLLAYAGMDESMHVTWIPSYGPEMRGGTAHCTVVLSDEEIGSPLVSSPYAVIVMNQPSLDKYESLVMSGGVLVVNTSLTTNPVKRADLSVMNIPANKLAEDLGNVKLANVVMVGALVSSTGILPLDAVKQALRDHMLKGRDEGLIQANQRALECTLEALATNL